MFKSARIKLTVWYVLISMLVSLTFSTLIFVIVKLEVNRFELTQRQRYERRLVEQTLFPDQPRPWQVNLPPNQALVAETQERILVMLLFINLAIAMLVTGAGYILAGQALKPIKNVMENQTQFVSDASHELNTPLTALKSTLEVYLMEKTSSKTQTIIHDCLTQVDKLSQLARSLLDLSAQTAQTAQKSLMNFETIPTQELIKHALDRIKPLAKKKHIILANTGNNYEIKGQVESLVQTLVILLDNAIKYSPAKSRVTIKTIAQFNKVQIWITDQGPGIDPAHQAKIFDRFYRVTPDRGKKQTGGYGLGLAIAQQIALNHQGKIWVKSQPTQGATFILELPLK